MDTTQSNVIKIAKGICIFLVVLGHTMIPSIRGESGIIYDIWTVIYLFHMPVFFAASGILYELNRERYERRPVKFIKSKFMLLIIPYISISVSVYFMLMILMQIPGLSNVVALYVHSVDGLGGALKEIITYENHVAQHLWFVIVLFLVFVINIMLSKANQKIVCWLLTIVPLFALPLLKAAFEIPDIPNYFLFEMPFFMVGRLFVQEKEILKRVTRVNLSPIIFAVLAGIYVLFIEGTDVLPQPIRWLYLFSTRCMGILMVLSISAVIERGRRFNAMFRYLESKSYPIYLLHQPYIVSGGAGVLNAVGIPHFLIIISVTVLGILVPLIIDRILENKNLYRILILGGRIKQKERLG